MARTLDATRKALKGPVMTKTFRKAQGMLVASIADGALIGKLDDFQFDLESGRIYGYRIKGTGVFSKTGGVAASQVHCIGQDLLLVQQAADVSWTSEKRNMEGGRAWASQYTRSRVISRRGAALGHIEDFVLAEQKVVGIVLSENRLLQLGDRIALAQDAVILDDPSVAAAMPAENPEWWKRWRK